EDFLALEEWPAGEVDAVEVDDVEDKEDGGGRRARTLQRREARAVPLHGHDLPVEHHVIDGELAEGGDDPAEPGIERQLAARPQLHPLGRRRRHPDPGQGLSWSRVTARRSILASPYSRAVSSAWPPRSRARSWSPW